MIAHRAPAGVTVSPDQIAAFARKWRVEELALFGSILRDDFRDDSDIDVLITFSPESPWSLLDFVEMERELSVLFGRPVDLVSRTGLERSKNWIRRKAILQTAEPIYAAR